MICIRSLAWGRPTLLVLFRQYSISRGNPSYPEEKTILPVLAGPINLQTKFLVVQASSPYNVIMGRDWLHKMRVVPSTLHQKLRFPTVEGIMELNRDQVAAKQCVLATVRHRKPTTEVNKESL